MINIVYEDNHLLVVEKPINIPVQKDETSDPDFLNVLKEYIKNKYQKPGNVYLGLVHRLDRPVGGIMVFAKTSKCASRLSKQIRECEFKKIYYAVIEGIINDYGIYQDKLLKNTHNNTVQVSNKGKEASLDYSRVKCVNNLSLVKINLQTGRSHQIRVQFSHHGYPLYGDHKYNKKCKKDSQIALFAQSISFNHPISKERLTFSIDLPKRYPWTLFEG